MEREKNKRAREDDGVEIESSSSENYNNNANASAKKRNVYGSISLKKEKNNEVEADQKKDCFKAWDWDCSHLAMGVFDFPWLKDGVISKSYEYCFDVEDNFLSSLERQDTLFFKDGVDFSAGECSFCETPEASMAHVQEAKLVEDMTWQKPFESKGLELELAEDGDCIWSFLLNKPL